jgi:hypothetical protein
VICLNDRAAYVVRAFWLVSESIFHPLLGSDENVPEGWILQVGKPAWFTSAQQILREEFIHGDGVIARVFCALLGPQRTNGLLYTEH